MDRIAARLSSPRGKLVYRLQGLSDLVLGAAGLLAPGWTAALMAEGEPGAMEPVLRAVGLVLFLFASVTVLLSARPGGSAARRLFPVYPLLNWGFTVACAAVLALWPDAFGLIGWAVVLVVAAGAVAFALAQHALLRS